MFADSAAMLIVIVSSSSLVLVLVIARGFIVTEFRFTVIFLPGICLVLRSSVDLVISPCMPLFFMKRRWFVCQRFATAEAEVRDWEVSLLL